MPIIPNITYKKDEKEMVSDIFSKMLDDRVILLTEGINTMTMTSVVSQMMYLNAVDNKQPIHLYISSPGGSVTDGFAIIDTMEIIKAPVYTYCLGLSASMGALIFLFGAKRYMLPRAELMLHQPLGGASGQASDIEISANRILKMKKTINEIISNKSKQDIKVIETITDRDRFFDANESIEFGLADEIITTIKIHK